MSDLYLFFILAMFGGILVIAVTVLLIVKKITTPNDALKQKIKSLEKEVELLKKH